MERKFPGKKFSKFGECPLPETCGQYMLFHFSLKILISWISTRIFHRMEDAPSVTKRPDCTTIAEVMGSNQTQAWIFFRFFRLILQLLKFFVYLPWSMSPVTDYLANTLWLIISLTLYLLNSSNWKRNDSWISKKTFTINWTEKITSSRLADGQPSLRFSILILPLTFTAQMNFKTNAFKFKSARFFRDWVSGGTWSKNWLPSYFAQR